MKMSRYSLCFLSIAFLLSFVSGASFLNDDTCRCCGLPTHHVSNSTDPIMQMILHMYGVRVPYTSVQAALDAAAAANATNVHVMIWPGTYYGQVIVNIPNVCLHGMDQNAVTLTWDKAQGSICPPGIKSCTDYRHGTIIVKKANFTMIGVHAINSYDYVGNLVKNATDPTKMLKGTQANVVMLSYQSTRAVIMNSILESYQDTLYLDTGLNWLFNVKIIGCTDFIYGAATAWFDHCEVQNNLARNDIGQAMLAPSTMPTTKYGLVFVNSKFTASRGQDVFNSTNIARPWNPTNCFVQNSSLTLINTAMGQHITKHGYGLMACAKVGSSVRDTYPSPFVFRFHEYGSTGVGAQKMTAERQAIFVSKQQAQEVTLPKVLGDWNAPGEVKPYVALGMLEQLFSWF